MHILISGVNVERGIKRPYSHMQWLYHQSDLGGDIGILRFRVGLFRRKLSVNISSSDIISLAILSTVNTNSQFDIYFISRKIFLNKTSL